MIEIITLRKNTDVLLLNDVLVYDVLVYDDIYNNIHRNHHISISENGYIDKFKLHLEGSDIFFNRIIISELYDNYSEYYLMSFKQYHKKNAVYNFIIKIESFDYLQRCIFLSKIS